MSDFPGQTQVCHVNCLSQDFKAHDCWFFKFCGLKNIVVLYLYSCIVCFYEESWEKVAYTALIQNIEATCEFFFVFIEY